MAGRDETGLEADPLRRERGVAQHVKRRLAVWLKGT
jgi:hypothetical protein